MAKAKVNKQNKALPLHKRIATGGKPSGYKGMQGGVAKGKKSK